MQDQTNERDRCRQTIRPARPAMAALMGLVVGLCASATSAQLRVVNYNIANLRGNMQALQNVLSSLHYDDKSGFAVPVSLFVFQEVHSANFTALANIVSAAAPPGVTYLAGTYTSSSSEDNAGGAQAMFYRQGFLSEITSAHVDIYTEAGRYADRWRMQLVGYSSSNAWFYIYSAHLKASTGASNEADRLTGVTRIRANADALPAGTHIIYAGDMNFYSNNESGYQHYFSAGNGQAIDPLGTGSWAGGTSLPNSANNYKHTQSPLFSATGGLVGGGMNDRFDLQLSTSAFHDGAGLSYITGTYRAVGNDGVHYNLAINNGNNFYFPGDLGRSNALANNLVAATDHIPVLVDYQIPAVMSATIIPNYGRVIQGATFSVSISVTNVADVVAAAGADELNFTATGGQNLSGVANGSVEALGNAATPSFALNTSIVGQRAGQVLVSSSSQGVQNGLLTLNTTGTVVRRSNPSFSNASAVTQTTLPMSVTSNTGVHHLPVSIYNFAFDSFQALLDVDSVSGLSAPYGYAGGGTTGIGSIPATLTFTFNSNGAAPGTYQANVSIQTSDEDLPGATATMMQLTLVLTVNAAAPCPADISPPPAGNGVVNIDDLFAVINSWGPCPAPPSACPADIDHNQFVNIDDLFAVINGWGLCP